MLSHHQKTEIMFIILQSASDSSGYVSWNDTSLMEKHSCNRAIEDISLLSIKAKDKNFHKVIHNLSALL